MEKMRFYTLWLSMAIVLVFLMQIFIPGFTDFFILSPKSIYMPWQFVTAIFMHGSFLHLIYNLFALLLFGFILEKILGSKNFLFTFLAGGIFANILAFSFYPSSLGASGAIMALIGMLAVLRPLMIVWAYGLILPMFVVAILWVVGSFMGIVGFGDDDIGYIAHLGGILLGILGGFWFRLKNKKNKESSTVYTRKIYIPDEMMRSWENKYFGK